MTDMAEFPSEPTGWLSDRELAHVRSELPLLYVNAIPVRINPRGEIAEIGLLLRADEGVFRAPSSPAACCTTRPCVTP